MDINSNPLKDLENWSNELFSNSTNQNPKVYILTDTAGANKIVNFVNTMNGGDPDYVESEIDLAMRSIKVETKNFVRNYNSAISKRYGVL